MNTYMNIRDGGEIAIVFEKKSHFIYIHCTKIKCVKIIPFLHRLLKATVSPPSHSFALFYCEKNETVKTWITHKSMFSFRFSMIATAIARVVCIVWKSHISPLYFYIPILLYCYFATTIVVAGNSYFAITVILQYSQLLPRGNWLTFKLPRIDYLWGWQDGNKGYLWLCSKCNLYTFDKQIHLYS